MDVHVDEAINTYFFGLTQVLTQVFECSHSYQSHRSLFSLLNNAIFFSKETGYSVL